MRPRVPKALNPETESQRLEFANDLKDNDDFLASILVDAFGTEEDTFMGVHYQSADFESRRPEIDNQEVFRIVKETVVEDDMTQGIIEMMSLPALEKYCEEKLNSDKTRIKTFQEHLKRYLSLYSPKCRVEIKMTDRYSWHTGHPELGIVATRDLLPLSGTSSFGHRLRWGKVLADDNEPWDKNERKFKRAQRVNTDPILTELTGGLAQLPYSMRKDLDDLDEHEYYKEPEVVIDLDAPMEPVESAFEDESNSETTGVEPRVVEVAEEEVKMRDFSIVQSSRYGTMLFLGPGRFLNHDCEPNVKLAASGTRSKNMTFKVIKPIRTGEEIYTYYGPNYFGPGNRECLCLTCEKNGRGVFTREIEEGAETGAELSDMMQTATLSTIRNDSDSVASSLRRCSGKNGQPDSPLSLAHAGSSSMMIPPRTTSVTSDSETEADDCYLSRARSPKSTTRLKAITRRPDAMLLRLDASELTKEERAHLRKMKGKDKAVLTPVKRVPPPSLLREGSVTPGKSVAAWPEDRKDNSPSRDRVRRQAGLAAESTLHTMIQDPWQKGKRFSKRVTLLGQLDRDDNESGATSSVAGGDDDPDVWRAPRCTTCMVQCSTLIQIGEFSITLCERCTRHHRIFGYPWPARSRAEVFKYPPRHVRPGWWRPNRADHRLRNEYMAGIDQEERALRHIIGGRLKRRQRTPEREVPPETPEEREARLASLASERAEELAAAERHFEVELQLARQILTGILEEDAEIRKKENSDKKNYIKGSSLWRRYEYVEITEEPEPDLSDYAGRTRRGRTFGRDSASGSVTPSIATPLSVQAPAPPVKAVEPKVSVSPNVANDVVVTPRPSGRPIKGNIRDAAEAEAEPAEDTSAAMDAAMELLNDAEAGVEGAASLGRVGSSPSELEREKLHPAVISPVRSDSFREGTASSVRTAEGIAVDEPSSLDTGSAAERSEKRPVSAGQGSDHTRRQITAALQENGLFPTSREREGGYPPRVTLDPVSHQLKTDRHPKRKLDGRAPGPITLLSGTTTSTNKRLRLEVPDDDFFEVPAFRASASSALKLKGKTPAKRVPPKLDLSASNLRDGIRDVPFPQGVIVLTDSPDEETFTASTPAKRPSGLSGANSISPRGLNVHPHGKSTLRAGTTIEDPIVIPDDPTPPADKATFVNRPALPKDAGVIATSAQKPSAARGITSHPAPRRRINLKDFHKQPEQITSTDSPAVDAQAAMRSTRTTGRSLVVGSGRVDGEEEEEVNALVGGWQDSTAQGSKSAETDRESTCFVPVPKVAKPSRHAEVERSTPLRRLSGWQDNASAGLSDSVIQTPSKRRRPAAEEDSDEESVSQGSSAHKSKMFSAAWAALRGVGLSKATLSPAMGSTAAIYQMTPSSISQAGRVAWDDITRTWGMDPRSALGPSLQPMTYDTALLLVLSALTGHFPSPAKSPVVLKALEQAINRRLSVQRGSATPRRLTVEDLEDVLKSCQCAACRSPRDTLAASVATEHRRQPSTHLIDRGPGSAIVISPVITSRLPMASLNATPLGTKTTTCTSASPPKQLHRSPCRHRTRTPHLEQSPPPHIPISSSPMALGLLGARNVFQRNRPWTQLSSGTDVKTGAALAASAELSN